MVNEDNSKALQIKCLREDLQFQNLGLNLTRLPEKSSSIAY